MTETPTEDPHEPIFVDGPFGSAEETRRVHQQACGQGPDDDPAFERLSDGGSDMQEYLNRKRRKLQEQQIAAAHGELVARSERDRAG